MLARIPPTWLLLAVLCQVACPEPRDAPEPSNALACEAHVDCNCQATCGALTACVGGYCEQGRSLLVPCREGQRTRAEDCQP